MTSWQTGQMTTSDISQAEAYRVESGVVDWFFHQPLLRVLSIQPVGACLMTAYFWSKLPHSLLIVWLSYMVSLSVLFTATTLYFRHQYRKPAEPLQLKLPFPLGGITVGIGWGMTSLWPNVLNNPSDMVFTTIVAMGVVASSIGFISPHIRAFYALVLLTIFPFVFELISMGGKFHDSLGLMLVLFMILVLISGHNMKRAVYNSIKLRFDNTSLLDELREKNKLAEQSREQAEQANLSKSKFLAAASHDLRQPLHALGLFVDVLETRIRYPDVRSIVNNIKICTDALAELFNSLLDISKLDAGVLEAKLTDMPLQPLLTRIRAAFDAKAQSKGISLRIRECAYTIHSDPAMLERILLNLVSNAIRYTSSGRVLLGCKRQGVNLDIEIYDTGIGIPTDKIGRIFDEFYQIENPGRDRRKGLGLGLSIVRRLSNLLNHDISIESVPDKGTLFRITVPLVSSIRTDLPELAAVTTDVENACVLIIDDEAMVRNGMRDILQQWGCKVVEAESAQHAMELLSLNKAEPDIVISDYHLRENKNGIEAIKHIRQALHGQIPAIIITGDSAADLLNETRACGLHLLHKPLSPVKLRSLLAYLLRDKIKTRA